MKHSTLRHFIVMLLMSAVFCCALSANEGGYSGFLGQYSKLRIVPSEPGVYYEVHDQENFGQYTKLMVSKVTLLFDPEVDVSALDQRQLDELRDYFRDETIKRMPNRFQIVDRPGKDVLVLRLGITEIIPNLGYLKTNLNPEKPGLAINHASIEADFNLSTTGDRIFALIDERQSKRLAYIHGTSTWWHTDDLLLNWNDLLHGMVLAQHDYFR